MDFFFLWLVTFVLGYWIFKKINQWKDLPPGPWGLPVLGYLPFLDAKQPHRTMTKLSKKFGSVYGLSMGSVYTVVLTDTKLIRDAFAKDVFTGRAPLYLTHGIMNGNGLICAEGGLWKDQRKLITTWLRKFGMSKHGVTRVQLELRIASHVAGLIDSIEKCGEAPIDICSMLNNSLGNVINDIIFGFKFPPGDKTYEWFRHIQEEACHELGVSGVLNFLPFVRFFSWSTQNTMHIIKRGQVQTHRLYGSIVAKRRTILGMEAPDAAKYQPHHNIFNEHPNGHVKCITYSKNTDKIQEHYFDPDTLIPVEGDCILDNFLLEQKKRFENGDETARYTTDEQLLYLLADMFGAGLDTSSVTLAWFFLYMALYPDEQENVRKEIQAAYADKKEVDTSELPYLMATICESQRIRSIVPVGIPHGCLEDTYLGNYRIPKGTMIVALQWAIHMNPDVWEDPEEFRPRRFLAADGSLLKPKDFIPFQTGKRMCPGDELSRMLACGLVVPILRKWRIRLAAAEPPSEDEMQGAVGVTLTPPHVLYTCEPLSQE